LVVQRQCVKRRNQTVFQVLVVANGKISFVPLAATKICIYD